MVDKAGYPSAFYCTLNTQYRIVYIVSSRQNYWSDRKKLWDGKMAQTSSITTPSMVGIVGGAAAVDEKLTFVTLWNDKDCDNGIWSSIIFSGQARGFEVGGLGAVPPAGSRGRARGQEVRGLTPWSWRLFSHQKTKELGKCATLWSIR